MTVQATFAATLVDEWARAGITDAVVAPGSRSTPLALALVQGGMRVHVLLDERSAGFFALGLAVATGRPAPIVTTSGTAPAHLLPAVIEADLSGVPMIACSADRPPELHHVGAPQTVEQQRLYDGFVRWQCSLGSVADAPPSAWRSIAARAAIEAAAGPVHLNLGFRDPLVGDPEALPPGRPNGTPWHARAEVGPIPSVSIEPLVSGRAGVIVVSSPVADPESVVDLGRRLRWPILAGPQSGCRDGRTAVAAFDALARVMPRPEVVLRFGGEPASKAFNSWVEGVPSVVVGPWIDPSRSASLVVPAAARVDVGDAEGASPDWAAQWASAERHAQDAISTVLSAHQSVTEAGVARTLTRMLGKDTPLLVASSMPIRYVEWYGDPRMACRVIANRGANGIDGLVSTALGVAAAGRGAVALLGDLAFLHDSGGLLGAARRGFHCTFVVIDNDGGGIFSFLPQATALEPDVFEKLFGTPHGMDLARLAAAYSIPATVVTRADDVQGAVGDAVAAGGVRLVVARTERRVSVDIHEELVAAVAMAVRS